MRQKLILTFFSVIFLILLTVVGIRSNYFQSNFKLSLAGKQKSLSVKKETSFDSLLIRCFEDLEVPGSQIPKNFSSQDSALNIKISVPKGKPMEWVIWYISSSLASAGYSLKDCSFESERKGAYLHLKSQEKNFPQLKLTVLRSSTFFSQTAKMAILIEDFGFKADQTTVKFLSFPEPLSVSVVSSRRLSTWTAQIANEYKKEILIMLPMEPLPKSFSRYDGVQIKIHYPEEKIKSIIKDAAETIPSFAGFCNFYGNRVLEDSRVMKIIFKEIQKHHGYFVITSESKKSIAESMAKRINLPYQKIDYTINSDNSAEIIGDSLRYFAVLAQKTGKVLVSGRASDSFITALQNTFPQLKQNGIQLVYVSEILNHPGEGQLLTD
jgi:polysaccharide deacetylase 2 family uncharacterized protein YibQ